MIVFMTTEGDKIQRLIDNLGMSQGAFADKIGIARSSLNRISGGKNLSGRLIKKGLQMA
jgi:hypothetical protein